MHYYIYYMLLYSPNADEKQQWDSSTGLTSVSKFKPRLPAQWAVGTHRSRMEENKFLEELTNLKFDSNSKLDLA